MSDFGAMCHTATKKKKELVAMFLKWNEKVETNCKEKGIAIFVGQEGEAKQHILQCMRMSKTWRLFC